METIRLWLAKANELSAKQAGIIIVVIGIAVFSIGLNNPFQGDDNYQIINNQPVHSIRHVVSFFESGTFYNGQQLTGANYRPMMTTVFSLIYTVFGAHPFVFHVVQLALYIASAFLLYLFFKYFLKPTTALVLALIFLVHPLNSQVVYSIPTMQDALFFFFGILALWILARYKSKDSLFYAAGCLFLAMLSKESALLFIIIALLYLFWFNRKRLRTFAVIMVLPIVVYFALKIHAVGLFGTQHGAPIDTVGLAGRVLTAPSVPLFYIMKFLFPWRLATGYYWEHPEFSVRYTLVPLIIELVIAGFFIYLGLRARRKLSKTKFHAYLFFGAWTVIGLLPYLQIAPLDMTACETWFYFSMAGLLGMIGIALSTFKIRPRYDWLILVIVLLIALLGVRSAIRGTDYRSQYVLARRDMAVSANDHSAINNVAQGLIDQHKFQQAAIYAQRSIDIYPMVSNYDNLGVALQQQGDNAGAVKAYNNALKYGSLSIVYENLGQITLEGDGAPNGVEFFQKALKVYPQDSKLWLYLALLEDSQGSNAKAKVAISNADKYGQIPQALYAAIMNNQPFVLPLPGSDKSIVVR